MGGNGSGQWTRWPEHETLDGCHTVDVRYLQRHKLLTPGRYVSLGWTRGGKPSGDITVAVEAERVTLIYRVRTRGGPWQGVREVVPLDWTPCHYGGKRAWFLCPGKPGAPCGRRVAVLYDGGRLFLCRHCYDLRYQSQREREPDRARERAQAIRRRLGGSASLFEPFPEKPKGMHWRTYERLRRRALAGEVVWDAAGWAWLEKSEARFNKLLAAGRR